ncbi:MAG: SDR family oxidoreductase [Gammaproteobacteria bacterium]|nr:MAG: SDR family oxidoreductase [Gammaproteobacteria bacterium]
MRILILGGDGMLGHQLLDYYQEKYDVKVTLRRDLSDYQQYNRFDRSNTYPGIDVRSQSGLIEVFSDFQPQVVINAVGIVKQRSDSKEAIPSIEINALLPHRLALLCEMQSVRLVHLSTDCVFSGHKGSYVESDYPDAKDLYGRTKLLGEVEGPGAITLRTSIIGLELARKKSLIEWFLSQKGTIKGYSNAIYSGFTTLEMAKIIEHVVLNKPDMSGVWHVASSPISKYELLRTLSSLLSRDDIEIVKDEDFICDRSLNADRFNNTAEYSPPSWDHMMKELAQQIRERME